MPRQFPIRHWKRNADAPPEKLLICFAAAEVTVLGSGLQAVERRLQKYELEFCEGGGPAVRGHAENPHCRHRRQFYQGKIMTADSPLKIRGLEKFPAVMTKEKVAEALGIAAHNIPPLVRVGLLKPLGHPGRYCVKHFSRDALAEKFANLEWLDKVVAAIHRHWRIKNARKRNQPKEAQ